jgi:hypothetical protein
MQNGMLVKRKLKGNGKRMQIVLVLEGRNGTRQDNKRKEDTVLACAVVSYINRPFRLTFSLQTTVSTIYLQDSDIFLCKKKN